MKNRDYLRKKKIYTTELNFELSNSGKDFYRSAPGSFPNKIALTRREKTEDDVTKHTQFNHVTMMSFCHRIAKRRNQTIQQYRHENTCHFAHFKVCFSATLYEFCCVVPSRVECAWLWCVRACACFGAMQRGQKSSLFSFSSCAPLTAIVSPSSFYCPAFEMTAQRGERSICTFLTNVITIIILMLCRGF